MKLEIFRRKEKSIHHYSVDDLLSSLEPVMELKKDLVYARLRGYQRASEPGDLQYVIPDLLTIGRTVILVVSWELFEKNSVDYAGIPEILESQILPLGMPQLSNITLTDGSRADTYFANKENFDVIAMKLGEIFQAIEGNDLVDFP